MGEACGAAQLETVSHRFSALHPVEHRYLRFGYRGVHPRHLPWFGELPAAAASQAKVQCTSTSIQMRLHGRLEGIVPGAWDETHGREDVPNAKSAGGAGSRPDRFWQPVRSFMIYLTKFELSCVMKRLGQSVPWNSGHRPHDRGTLFAVEWWSEHTAIRQGGVG
jgi:hypothetical protein